MGFYGMADGEKLRLNKVVISSIPLFNNEEIVVVNKWKRLLYSNYTIC